MVIAIPRLFSLLRHDIACAFCFALFNAGRSIPARIAKIEIVISNSINVKLFFFRFIYFSPLLGF